MSIQAVGEWLQATAVGEALRASAWLVPLLQSIHIVMIGVVFVSIMAMAARVLGWWRAEQSLAQVWARFAPFLWIGVLIMALSGVLLVLSEPLRELMTISFRVKILLIAVAVVSALAFGRRVRAAAGKGAGAAAVPAGTPMRLAAVATVLLWLAIIFLGRAIAYDDSIWGSWSPAFQQQGGAP
jgi:hypothetical protein